MTTSNPMSDEMRELARLLRNDAIGLQAWADGKGPYPETVRGVCKMKAERAAKAATAIETLSERIAVLRDGLDAICAMLAGHAGQPTHLGDVYKIADAARATPQQENQP